MEKLRIEFNSVGEGGNIFAILGLVRTGLEKQGRIEEYDEICYGVEHSRSYREALDIIRLRVDLVDLDGNY